MARRTPEPVQMYRGTTAQHSTYTGPVGEITVDVDKDTLVVHDGTTPGGHPLAKAATTITASNGVSVTSGGTLGANTAIAGVDATTSAKGVVQLSNATTGTSQTAAATEKAVSDALQAAKDYADQAAAGGGNYTGTAPIAVDQTTHVISAADATTAAKGVVQLSNAINGTSQTKAATEKAVADARTDAINHTPVPVGTIIWSGAATVPAGYLLCNGSAVGRTTYPELFAAIGTTFGSGDGSTTFNLPNLIDKFIEGANAAGTVKAAGLPNITGTRTGLLATYRGVGDGAFTGSQPSTGLQIGSSGSVFGADGTAVFNASNSNAIYGSSATVQPPAVTALPCIKAFDAVIGDATVVAGQLVNDIQGKVNLDGSNTSSISKTLSTYMANSAMPSGQYIDLTLPASGGTVTAPADGWITFSKDATGANQYLYLQNPGKTSAFTITPVTAGGLAVYVPVASGDVVVVTYTAAGTLQALRFNYANGSAPAA